MISLARDMGYEMELCLAGDATAASGVAHRRGAGRIRHIHTKTLWLQRHVTEKRVKLSKTLGTLNVADIGTKHLSAAERDKLLRMMGYRVATGRSDIAVGIAGDFTLEPARAGTAADAAEDEDE